LDLILKDEDLIIDEIQHIWPLHSDILIKIIEIVDQIKPANRLILIGTPQYGKIPIDFDSHIQGRMVNHTVRSFSCLEIYAILSTVLGQDINFDIFLSLWSCFDGIPGLYELAYNSQCFNNNSLNLDILFQQLNALFLNLQPQEIIWISKIDEVNGYTLQVGEEQDPVLQRLLKLKIFIQHDKQIFIRDKIVKCYNQINSSKATQDIRLKNLRGHGFESMTKSIGLDILKTARIPLDIVEKNAGNIYRLWTQRY